MTRLPPGPRSALPQLRHMRDPFPYMVALAREFGDTITVPILGAEPIVCTADPTEIRAIFSADPLTFASATHEAISVILGRGSIFLQAGEPHRRTRKLLMPAFHGERVRGYASRMQQATVRWSASLPRDRVAPILPVAQGITLDVIIEAIFGEQDPARVRALHEGILGVVESFNPLIATFAALQREFFGLGPWAKFRRKAEALEATMRALIALKRDAPGDDVLSLLVAARDEEAKALSEREIIEQLLTFVVAGHETTATSVAWAVYELLRAPDALATLTRELDEARGGAAIPSAESLVNLRYLRAVCDETLRMHPPVPLVQRRCAKPLTLGAHELPAGTMVAANAFAAHHREAVFAEPFAFRPERFIEKSYTPFEYLPFGGGHRRCLGAAFAGYELAVVLGTLLSSQRFELAEPAPVRNAFRIGTYGPETGVRVRALA
jgi:cytochrome P450